MRQICDSRLLPSPFPALPARTAGGIVRGCKDFDANSSKIHQ